jgi:O-acetyl-ADP-ribose deacetylase (regulator of RNase III)
VGIPPYPGSRHPRVVGVLRPLDKTGKQGSEAPLLKFVRGDALKPRGSGPRIVVHIVNDKTPNWGGGGFAEAIKRRWPDVQTDFRKLIAENRDLLALGNVRIFRLPDGMFVASVVAQKGYGESVRPRIRYSALRKGLEAVASAAIQERATVHMPRIGAGQGRGSWSVIEDIVQTVLGDKGVPVTVYDLPGAELPARVPLQDELSFVDNS